MTSSVWLYNHPNFSLFFISLLLCGAFDFLSLENLNQNSDDHTNIIQLLYKD